MSMSSNNIYYSIRINSKYLILIYFILIFGYFQSISYYYFPQLNLQRMDQELLGAEEDFEMSIQNINNCPQQQLFNQIIMALQDVMVDQDFQNAQQMFMKSSIPDLYGDLYTQSEQLMLLFNRYQQEVVSLFKTKMQEKVPSFSVSEFFSQANDKQDCIDPQIYQLLGTCINLQTFRNLVMDYKTAHEEQQRYRVLTVKTNKMPETKKVKGNNENIFSNSNKNSLPTGLKPLKNSTGTNTKQGKMTSEKNQFELLVPETVLTVKGLRKC